MRKKLASIILAGALALTAVFASYGTAAALDGSNCGGTVHIKIGTGNLMAEAYEYHDFNGGVFADGIMCIYAPATGSTSVADFKSDTRFIDGWGGNHCDGQLFSSYGTWNDCISSLQFISDCHHTLTFYGNASYDTVEFSATGTVSGVNFGGLVDNTFSSLRLQYHSACLD